MTMSIVKIADEDKDLLSWLDEDGNLVQFELPETEITIRIYSNANIASLNKLQQVLIDLCTSVIVEQVRLTSNSNRSYLTGNLQPRNETTRIISSMSKDFPKSDIKERRNRI